MVANLLVTTAEFRSLKSASGSVAAYRLIVTNYLQL